jgi:hypothetical protein
MRGFEPLFEPLFSAKHLSHLVKQRRGRIKALGGALILIVAYIIFGNRDNC